MSSAATILSFLVRKSAIDKISVTEICRAADIERPTFYYHFRDKYDLVAWMFCTDAYETDITSPASAAAGMNRMKQEILFYRRAYEDSSQNALWRYMLEYFVRRYTELVKKSWAPIFSIPSLLTVFGFIVWALSA